jgi:hypothetical protein
VRLEPIFVTLEQHLEARFENFCARHKFQSYNLGLSPRFSNNFFEQLTLRLRHRSKIKSALSQLLSLNEDRVFILSNAEGYIAENAIRFIRKHRPNSKIVAVQHGDFEFIAPNNMRGFFLRALNLFSTLFFQTCVAGRGFGGTKVDLYVVFNAIYKDFLINNGYAGGEVLIGSRFIFGEGLYPPKTRRKLQSKQSTAVFALQPLSNMGIVSPNLEKAMNDLIIQFLKDRYEVVLLKHHPYAKSIFSITDVKCLPDDEPVEDILLRLNVNTLVSFSSSLLLKLERWPIELIAFFHPSLNKYSSVYPYFKNVMELDLENNCIKNCNRFEKSHGKGFFYEAGVANKSDIFSALGII